MPDSEPSNIKIRDEDSPEGFTSPQSDPLPYNGCNSAAKDGCSSTAKDGCNSAAKDGCNSAAKEKAPAKPENPANIPQLKPEQCDEEEEEDEELIQCFLTWLSVMSEDVTAFYTNEEHEKKMKEQEQRVRNEVRDDSLLMSVAGCIGYEDYESDNEEKDKPGEEEDKELKKNE